MILALAASGGGDPWIEVWIGPIVTIAGTVLAALLGPQWLNRRNARATATASAKKDEATSAQVIEQASVGLITEWRLIAERAKAEIASYHQELDKLSAQVVAAELGIAKAERRATVAEKQALLAERRANEVEARAREAEQQVRVLVERVTSLEHRLVTAGIPLEAE